MIHDLADRPDFLWDDPLTRDDLKKLLNGENEEESLYYAAKILREARFEEVWDYFSPPFLASHWEKLRWRLGRKRGFWEFFYTTHIIGSGLIMDLFSFPPIEPLWFRPVCPDPAHT